MSTEENVGEALLSACRRHLFEESWPRIVKAVAQLGPDELWYRPNDRTNSVGNLLLHLSGNVRQWIVSGLGGAPDERARSHEFSERGPLPKKELMERLERTLEEARTVIEALDSRRLVARYRIQGYDVTGVGVLVHVVEHFSYHVGQIAHIAKSLRGVDLDYYGDRDLDQHNEPR